MTEASQSHAGSPLGSAAQPPAGPEEGGASSRRSGRASSRPLQWPEGGRESRPWTRWWWFGSAVDEANLTAALEELAAAGMGGVEICPVYGAKGAEGTYLEFLSPDWMAALAHTCREADRLGLGVDLTTGTGWPFGGRGVNEGIASIAVRLEGDELQSSGPVQKVKRAAPGGEGWVLDPFSEEAMGMYLAQFEIAFDGFDAPMPRAHFHDSFEYFGAEWTRDLPEEFQRRRGYDLREHAAALFGKGDGEVVSRVRCDYRETMGELHLAYIRRWSEWARARGGRSRNQAHGVPGNIIDAYAAADIPETEIFGDADERLEPMLKFASSAAHLKGGNLASAESFTWLGEHFQVSLADLKPAAELLFLSGINHLFFHGTPYSPAHLPWPGWLFYASVHMGREGGLWRDLPSFNAYLTRCQSVLQSGRPSADLLLYFPVYDFWQREGETLLPCFKMPGSWMWDHDFHRTGTHLREGGWDFDAVSDRFLEEACGCPGGIAVRENEYAAIVVPPTRVMPLETGRRLVRLAEEGGVVLFLGGFPTEVPGLADAQERAAALASLWRGLGLGEGGGESRQARVGRGVIWTCENPQSLMQAANVSPEPMSSAGLRWVRRRQDDGYHYLVVNRPEQAFEGWIDLKFPAGAVAARDPVREERRGYLALRQSENGTSVYLQMMPGESLILQTIDQASPAAWDECERWVYHRPAGEAVPLRGHWQVEFIEGGPEMPAPFSAEQLRSWTDSADEEAKRFAGTARYRLSFEHKEAGGDDWLLDLGRVAESARVRLNGIDLGCWWAPPFHGSVEGSLRSGENCLEIEVTNVAANRIADLDRRGVPWKNFHEINFVDRSYRPFDASDWPLRPSGLLGPVSLIPIERFWPEG